MNCQFMVYQNWEQWSLEKAQEESYLIERLRYVLLLPSEDTMQLKEEDKVKWSSPLLFPKVKVTAPLTAKQHKHVFFAEEKTQVI